MDFPANTQGWAQLPPYAIFHFYHAAQRGETVQMAACNVPSLRPIAPELFTRREIIAAHLLCPKCDGQAATIGARALAATASLLLGLLLLSGCREPQPAPATRNLQPAATATPPCREQLAPRIRQKMERGELFELSPEDIQQWERTRPCGSPTPQPTPTALIGEPL